MNLTVKDRFALLSILPEKGDFTTLKVVRELRETLSFTEEEHAAFGFRSEGEMIFWAGNPEREFAFLPKAAALIVDALKKADAGKSLTDDMVDVYEKFMGAGDGKA